MSTVRGPRPQINSMTETRSEHTQNQPQSSGRLLPSPSGNLPHTIPKSQFVCEIRAPAPLRTRSRYPSWEFQPSREMLKQRVTRKSKPSPLANSSMTWEEVVQDKPREGPSSYQSLHYSGYGQLSSSSSSFGRLNTRLERKKTPQIYGVDHDEEYGFLCFGRCWFTSMFSLENIPVPPGTNSCCDFLVCRSIYDTAQPRNTKYPFNRKQIQLPSFAPSVVKSIHTDNRYFSLHFPSHCIPDTPTFYTLP